MEEKTKFSKTETSLETDVGRGMGRLIGVFGLLLFPWMLSAQVEHWVFELQAESKKKDQETITIHLYAKAGGFAIGGSWKGGTRKIVCDSVAGKVLLLNTNGSRKTYSFEPLTDTVDGKSFEPNIFPDFDREGTHFDLLPETKTVCGYEAVHLEGVFDRGVTGDVWIAPGLTIPVFPVFTLPDGRTGAWIASTMNVARFDLKMVFRLTEHEVLESVKESVFSMKVPEGYKSLEDEWKMEN